MRKPPGLRFRFALRGRRDQALGDIESAMRALTRRKAVRRWFPTVYEPETFKFGGPDAMDAVHAHFDADSMGWWRWERLRQSSQTTVAARLLSTCILNDLFTKFLEGPEEVWDVWCRIAALHGEGVTSADRPLSAFGLEQLRAHLTPAEQALVRRYQAQNQMLARRFAAIGARGRLLYAHRLVLPHVALYHWNRYGFSPDERASMFSAMIHAWSPNRPAAAL